MKTTICPKCAGWGIIEKWYEEEKIYEVCDACQGDGYLTDEEAMQDEWREDDESDSVL